MSETEDLEILAEELPPSEPKTKPKKVMSELQLEKLKLAREKAAQVKKAARAEKDKLEAELREKEKAKRLAKLEEKVKNSHIDLEKPTPLPERGAVSPPKQKSLEEQVEVIRKPKKSKKKVVVMHDSGSDSSDSETQVIYIPKKKNKPKNAPTTDVEQKPQNIELPPQRHIFGYAPRYNSFY